MNRRYFDDGFYGVDVFVPGIKGSDCKGADMNAPDAVIDSIEANGFSGEQASDIPLAPDPADAAAGHDATLFVSSGIKQIRQARRVRARRAVVMHARGMPFEPLVRPL